MSVLFRVYVVAPRRKKEGLNWQLVAKPPESCGAKVKRKSSGTRDRAEAEQIAREWEAMLNGLAAPLAASATFGDLAAKHLAARETDGTPAGTVTTYRVAFKRVRDTLGQVSLLEVDGPAVARTRNALVALGLDGKTVNVTMSRCRSTWLWGVELGHVKGPWPQIRGAKARRTKKRPMRPREVAAFLSWAAGYKGGRWLPFFSVAAETGARSGDVCALDGRHVDRENNRVWIRDQKRKTERWAGVTSGTMALLPVVGPDDPVFTTQRGRPKTNAVLHVFRLGVKALKIPDGERLDVHSLRRMNSKEADRAGVPIQLAMKQQGHEDAARQARYGHDPDDDEDMSAVAQAIASRWTPYLDPLPSGKGLEGQTVATPEPHRLVTNQRPPATNEAPQPDTTDTPDQPVAPCRDESHRVVTSISKGFGAFYARWSDEGPEARAALRALRLLGDAIDVAHADAYGDVIPAPESGAERARKATS